MEEQQIGWIAAIIIGGIAGWLAEQFMKSQMGLLLNIVLGIVGAAVASALFSFIGIHFAGWIGYLKQARLASATDGLSDFATCLPSLLACRREKQPRNSTGAASKLQLVANGSRPK